MTLMYSKLLDINEHEQTATMIAELYHEWTDFRLIWNASDHDGIEAIMMNHNKIWVPDVMPVDLISYDKNLDPDRQNVLVASNGTVMYFVSIIIKFTCKIDVWAFPFDNQECRIRMGSRNFLTSEVDLVAELFDRVTVEDMSNGEWQATDVWIESGPNIFDMYGWEYPVVSIVFRVSRNSNYYVHAMILPSFMLTILVMFGIFWSPVDEKNYMERLSLGFAAKLAMLMVLQITSDNMPKSDRIPILSLYIMVSLVMITMAVIMGLFMAKFLNHADALKRRECDQKRAENGELCSSRRCVADWLCTNAHSVCLFLFSGATIANVALLLLRGQLQC